MLRSTAQQNLMFFFKFKVCSQDTLGFYTLRHHKNTRHGFLIKTTFVGPDDIVNEIDVTNLKEELRSYPHFVVNFELQWARHKVFHYAVETLNETIVNEKLDHFLNNLKYAVKVNLDFAFISKNLEDGGFSHFYAHENNTLVEWSKLVFTKDDLAKLKDILNKTDVIESCSREKKNTKWKLY